MQREVVKRLRDDGLARVCLRVSHRFSLAYELAGGHQTPNPWRAVGFYSEIKERTRVVFELLMTASAAGVLLRVYRE